MRVRELSSRTAEPPVATQKGWRDVFFAWPQRRSTSLALVALLIVQATFFLTVTRSSFFFADDYNYFKLAEERNFFLYLLTPILGVYPAPGDRLGSFLLQKLFPLNFIAARLILLVFLVATTVLLWQLVRGFARRDEWWTALLLVPFALSLTLVVPFTWWSAGIPIVPALLFTVAALSAWLRSYTDPKPVRWLGIAVVAIAAAGAFYMKFLLIPVYLLFFRLVILPSLLGLPRGRAIWRDLWRERWRWVALGAPCAIFLAVYVLSGLAGRSAAGGSRPYLPYLAAAWFRAVIPAAFLNARVVGSGPSIAPWVIVICSQAVFWGVVAATWARSALALRAWALFVFVFALNVLVIGTVRLPAFGVKIAYDLRYYPEVVLFLPLTLALAFRQGEERGRKAAWERTRPGRTGIAVVAGVCAVSFLLWAPGIVSDSPGVPTRAWYQNLQHDIDRLTKEQAVPRIVDSETPTYVMPEWMATDNRVSTILELAHVSATYNALDGRIYVVRSDGHLGEAVFHPIVPLVTGGTLAQDVHLAHPSAIRSSGVCVRQGDRLQYRPRALVDGPRLTIHVLYAGQSHGSARVAVDADDPDRPFRYLELRPFQTDAELVDLGTSRVRSITVAPLRGSRVCIDAMEIGSVSANGD
jgi:hypothetical protein